MPTQFILIYLRCGNFSLNAPGINFPCYLWEPHQLISRVKIMCTVDAGMFSNHCELEESEASLTFTKEAVLDSIFAEYTILPICFAAVWMKKKKNPNRPSGGHCGLLVGMESLLVTLSWQCLTLSVCHFYQ